MFTRTTGFLIVPIWFAAMGWLVMHDVWPRLAAHEPPPLTITDWLKTSGEKSQFTITDDSGGTVGTIWSAYSIDEGVSTTRDDLVHVERLALPIAPLTASVISVYTGSGLLDEFTVRIANFAGNLELHGERFHAAFSFTLTGMIAGKAIESRFKLPLAETGLLTNGFQPFTQLANLSVGQTWRMQVYNPVAAVTGIGDRFIDMLVTVGDREKRVTKTGVFDCFVVQSHRARAWVDDRGVVREQEITLPVVGTLRIMRESGYDEDARSEARRNAITRRRVQP